MTYVLVPILDGNDKLARALIVTSETGGTYEVLEPEGDPIPGPRIDELEANRRDQTLVKSAIEAALANTTFLHPALDQESEHATIADALAAADVLLAGPTGRVPRQDLDPAEQELLVGVGRWLKEIGRRVGSLPSKPLDEIPAEVEALRGLVEKTNEWVNEFRTRGLHPRVASAVEEALNRCSPLTRIATLSLPVELVEQLQQIELYTLEDLTAHEDPSALPALEPQDRTILGGALTSASMPVPAWLDDVASKCTPDTASGPPPPALSPNGEEPHNPPETQGPNDRPIRALAGVSPATYRALERGGLTTVGDLIRLSATELKQTNDVGPRRIAELKSALSEAGLRLRSGRGKPATTHGRAADGTTPNAAKPALPPGPGYGTLERLTAKGYGFLRTPYGETLFVNETEMANIGCVPYENMTVYFHRADRVEQGKKNRAARQVLLAVPDVLGKLLPEARRLLSYFSVTEETGGRGVWFEENWTVEEQDPPAGTPTEFGAIVTIHLDN